jgi:hypothetical protein
MALVVGIFALVAVTVSDLQSYSAGVIDASRSFYGALRIQESGSERSKEAAFLLVHGVVVHGVQYRDPARRLEPTGYYSQESGAGLAILHHPRRAEGLRVGLAGLGIGTLAAFGQPADVYRFYEINPDVTRLAEGEGGYFDYLQESPAVVEIVHGDARIAMEAELAAGEPQDFDVLVLDAFSSDAIPVHLLTQEAFEVYLKHLRPGGVIAVHISSLHVDLQPVLAQVAEHFGLNAILVDSEGDGMAILAARWALLTADDAFLVIPAIAARGQSLNSDGNQVRLWTDNYSNLFQILK